MQPTCRLWLFRRQVLTGQQVKIAVQFSLYHSGGIYRQAVIQAPRRGEIPRVQIVDLCEGCISLSNAEGFENGLLYLADIILTQ